MASEAPFPRDADDDVNWLHDEPNFNIPVVDQKDSSSWAIAAALVTGYYYFLATGDKRYLPSAQELCDRVYRYRNSALGGGPSTGSVEYALEHIQKHGVGMESDYPFQGGIAKEVGPIDPRSENPRLKLDGYETIDDYKTDSARIVEALKEGPLVATLDQTQTFFDYKGIQDNEIYNPSKDRDKGAHCVVVMGINIKKGYFLIRNSYGPQWGRRGYGKVSLDTLYGFARPHNVWKELGERAGR